MILYSVRFRNCWLVSNMYLMDQVSHILYDSHNGYVSCIQGHSPKALIKYIYVGKMEIYAIVAIATVSTDFFN